MTEQLIPAKCILPYYDLGDRVLYDLSDRVLVEVLLSLRHYVRTRLPGTIEKKLGLMDLDDGRVSLERVDFPVIQHHYYVDLDKGGTIMNAE